MNVKDLGYTDAMERYRLEHNLNQFEVGRVISEHRERYIVKTNQGEFQAEITGNMRFMAISREDFPAVGDWVALTTFDGEMAIIHHILPRYSLIKRQAVGQFGEIQIIASNIDTAFLLQAVDRDFNINRLERYLTICHSSKVKPIIVLTKSDLTNEAHLNDILKNIQARVKDIPVISISNETKSGYEILESQMERGKTYCMLGSSGVGKSTLLNNLSGKSLMKTDQISQSSNKGKHITSHRELILLDNGSILIDNPGMREVGIADAAGGLEATFDKIFNLAHQCKFKDCTHTMESGCRVIEAVEKGEIDNASYQNYLKMEKEKAHFESTLIEKRRKDKEFGKIIKNYKKLMKNNKK